MTEIWKPIPGFSGRYLISDHGQVKSASRTYAEERDGIVTHHRLPTKAKSFETDRDGYLHVMLSKNGKRVNRRVHRLVARTFIPNPNGYRIVNHKNEDRQDNRASNLEWCTSKHNYHYGNCRFKNHLSQAITDSRHLSTALLTKHDVALIKMIVNLAEQLDCLQYREKRQLDKAAKIK